MTKRLTAEEVADRMNGAAIELRSPPTYKESDLLAAAFESASRLITDNIVPRWQDEPDAEGEYHVEGIDPVCYVSDGVVWRPTWDSDSESARIVEESLNGRRVCRIIERPNQ